MANIKIKRTTSTTVPSSLPYGELGIANNSLYFGRSDGVPAAASIVELSGDTVRITDLDTGIYKITSTSTSFKIYYYGTTSTNAFSSTFNNSLLSIRKWTSGSTSYWN
jgi:hypothetical protein